MSSSESQPHAHGEALNIIKFNNNQIEFDESKLSRLLLHPDVKNREIQIFSIVGAYRKGKSFFMDYCLRFMYANYKSLNYPSNPLSSPINWIGDANEPLQGFSWRSGSVRDTTGLSFWSDVFLHDPPNGGTPIAIILVDTQGLFDPETSTEENAKILTLTTLISSMMVLNLNNVIQEDQLQYLQYSTEFATFASSSSDSSLAKPFQKFLFLVRDWQNVDEFDFGMSGGERYLDKILKSKAGQSEELRSVREHIRDSFDEILCYLLPYPGKKVASSSDYDGRWSEMDEDFLSEMKIVIENILKADKITVKKVNGVTVNGSELFQIISDYIRTFSTPQSMPKAKTLYELTVGKFLTELVNTCYEIYEKNLKTPEKNVDEMNLIHDHAESAALSAYATARKMGSRDDDEKYKKILNDKIHKKEVEWKETSQNHLRILEEERQKQLRAQEEAARIRQMEIDSENKRREEELQRQLEEKRREVERQQEELRKEHERIEEEKRRQKEAEEAIERARLEQIRLEEERRRLEEQARIAREQAEEAERERERNRIRVSVKELGINFHIPKPRCSVM